MAVVLMSKAELSRVDTLARVDRGELPVAGAASLLGLSPRQVFRLLARFRAEGASGLASRRRGRPSTRRLPAAVREAALAVVRERYADFGPTLAAEKLEELHDIRLSRETLRHWMSEAGLWAPRKARRGRVHHPRHRRDCLGELVQVDGCEHAWFEDRGPPCTLLVFVDDATSRLMHLRSVPAESAFAYMAATRAYVEAHGKPVAFYSDKHGVFRVNPPDAARGDGMTQFGRALAELDVDIICANSPQAKGRGSRRGCGWNRGRRSLRLVHRAMTGGGTPAETTPCTRIAPSGRPCSPGRAGSTRSRRACGSGSAASSRSCSSRS